MSPVLDLPAAADPRLEPVAAVLSAAHARQPFASGTAWHYSLGVGVAGGLREAATALPLVQGVREQVTLPLGMRDTGIDTHRPARLATPHGSDTPQPHRLAKGEAA